MDYERVFYARRPILEIAVKNFLENQSFQADFKHFEKAIVYGWMILLSLWQLKSILAIKHCKNGMIKKAVARDPSALEKISHHVSGANSVL